MPPSAVRLVVTKPAICSTAHCWKWYLSRSHKSCAPSTVHGTPSTVKSWPSIRPGRSCRRTFATRLMAWMAMAMPICAPQNRLPVPIFAVSQSAQLQSCIQDTRTNRPSRAASISCAQRLLSFSIKIIGIGAANRAVDETMREQTNSHGRQKHRTANCAARPEVPGRGNVSQDPCNDLCGGHSGSLPAGSARMRGGAIHGAHILHPTSTRKYDVHGRA